MIIRVDADACPVKEAIIRIGSKYDLDIVMYIDVNHILNYEGVQVITVDQGADSVDLALVSAMTSGDVVVTNDYGLASLVLGKKGYAMDANGREFDLNNIDRLLFERHMHKEIRQMKKRHKGPKKRTKESDHSFSTNFDRMLERIIQTTK